MIHNRWKGERISIANDTRVPLMQTHLSRYVWAMEYCVEKDVLDVGCGTGYGTWLESIVATKALGIDMCAEAIEEAKQTFGGEFFCTTLEGVEIDKQFDVVTCFEVLEHLNNLDVGMEAIARYMKPNGIALISLPLHQPSEFHHRRDFSYQQWKALLSQYFDIKGIYYQEWEDDLSNNVCIMRAYYIADSVVMEDWHEAFLRIEPDTGIIIFVCHRKATA